MAPAPMTPSSPSGKNSIHGIIIALAILNTIGVLLIYFKLNMIDPSLSNAQDKMYAKMEQMNEKMIAKPDATTEQPQQEQTKTIKWTPYGKIYGTLHFSYPTGFFVKHPLTTEPAPLTLESSAMNLNLSGGVECEPGDACTSSGLRIAVRRFTKDAEPIPASAKAVYPNIAQWDLKDICKDADGPCYPPFAQYLFQGKNDDYQIIVEEKDFSGNAQEIIDGFLKTLHE